MLHELPLVIFTICAQMSVGSFIALGLINILGWKVPAETMKRVTRPALYAIGPLLVLGLAASTLHLGSPLRAVNAIRHLDGSWLSREILFGMAFLVLGAAFAISEWFGWFNVRLRQALAAVAALVGIGLVWCISMVYSLRTIPAWSTYHTPVRFYITTFLLGGLAVGAALVIAAHIRTRRTHLDDPAGDKLLVDSVRGIALGGVLALGLKFIGQPAYMAYLGTHPDPAATESLDILVNTYGGFSAAQNILIFAGILLLGILLFLLSGKHRAKTILPIVAVTAFVLVLAGEVIGRMLFYASMVRTGL
ncbi:MAG: dimethyl sulfoxide reductase anchor subunit [Propionibacterium sp.]|nr:dimethyl sulfoxide reductase anchor subunit [Propionibacterium sp.]